MKQQTKWILGVIKEFLSKFEHIQIMREDLSEDDIITLHNILDKFQYKTSTHLKQGMILVDLRCWVGMTSILINQLRGEYDGLVYAVDDFFRPNIPNLKYLNIRNVLEDNIGNAGAWSSLRIIEKTPLKATENFKDNTIDVVFFNGITTYEEMLDNLDAWYNKVKSGGLIIGRNCETLDCEGVKNLTGNEEIPFSLHLGVIKAIKEKFPNAKKTEKGTIWYTYK